MNELDEVWLQMMDKAITNAHATGRSEVAEYLALKATNDSIRSTGCKWLFDSLLELSEEVNRNGIRLEIESENPHRFAVGHSTMVGSLVKFRHGVRCLTVEAGWTRTPNDGFMRGGALACARILHFGMSKFNAELLLIGSQTTTPKWFAVDEDGKRKLFNANDLREHFTVFLEL